jgi:A/G-specific adenine glycosylase
VSDRELTRAVEAWFRREARELPWREPPRDPWGCLVAELMLQQTQVSRVVEKHRAFLERFPTPEDLARAEIDEVLSAWEGLGYYRRARHLKAAAEQIVERHGGRTPGEAAALIELKGVGRYTAGAVASIVFGEREPIVDGNVARVLVRIDGRAMRSGEPATMRWAWERAEALVQACRDPAALNEGLMELGATVCTPRRPRCDACPAGAWCVARKTGEPEAFPLPKKAAAVREVFHAVLLVSDARGRVLVERRAERGLWAGMWQPAGLEREDEPVRAEELAEAFGAEGVELASALTHMTSHRLVRLGGYVAAAAEAGSGRRWATREELAQMAMAAPHRRIVRAFQGA